MNTKFLKYKEKYKKMQYEDIVNGLSQNLPNTMYCGFIFVSDVEVAIERCKSLIEHHVHKNNMKMAIICKSNLLDLYIMVNHFQENHNKTFEEFKILKYGFRISDKNR